MRIQCHACGARYAIADDKVSGEDRVFKIRCKSCSGIITIHGISQTQAGDDISDPPAKEEPPVWYYVVDGEQVGPVTAAGLEAALSTGALTAESFVWQGGMPDWRPLAEVNDLQGLLAPATEVPAGSLDELPTGEEPVQTASEPRAEVMSELKNATKADTALSVEATRGDGTERAEAAPGEATERTEAPALSEVSDRAGATPPETATALEGDQDRTIEVPSPWAAGAVSDPHAVVEAAAAAAYQERDEAETKPAPTQTEEPVDTDATLADLFVGDHLAKMGVADDHGGDLFGGAEDVVSSADDLAGLGQETDENGEMVWQRHDNSVLFSLSDLDDKREKEPQPETKKAAALAALTADSGLIDIRSFKKKRKEKAGSGDLFGGLPEDGKAGTAAVASAMALSGAPGQIPILQRRKKKAGTLLFALLGAAAVAGITAFLVISYTQKTAVGGNPAVKPVAPAMQVAQADTGNTNGTTEAQKTGTEEARAAERAAAAKTAAARVVATKTAAARAAAAAAAKPADAGSAPLAAVVASPGTATNGMKTAEPRAAKPGAATVTAAADTPGAGAPGTPTEAEAPGGATKAVAPGTAPATPAAAVKHAVPAKPLTPAEKERHRKLREKRKTERAARAAAKAEAAARAKTAAAKAATAKAAAARANTVAVDPNALLARTMKTAPAKPKATAAANNNPSLPAKLTSGMVRKVMKGAARKVRACAKNAGLSGVQVNTAFKVAPNGRVGGVSVSGAGIGAMSGCVKGAIGGLKFPATQAGRKINYPFVIR